MRGQVSRAAARWAASRITPADAGTRAVRNRLYPLSWDHPRGCGDKVVRGLHEAPFPGSPPRMRGQGHVAMFYNGRYWITPADAGTSAFCHRLQHLFQDHPRGCGDKPGAHFPVTSLRGSPPRMRGQAADKARGVKTEGITPADAGTSTLPIEPTAVIEDHPRGCGDKLKKS